MAPMIWERFELYGSYNNISIEITGIKSKQKFYSGFKIQKSDLRWKKY